MTTCGYERVARGHPVPNGIHLTHEPAKLTHEPAKFMKRRVPQSGVRLTIVCFHRVR
jgi:hypothetical protein